MDQYVALYGRISRDKTGRVEGVSRQEGWGRDYATRMWPDLPVRVYADNNVSAFDDDAVRPGYDALREAIRNGEVAHLWAVEQTRLEANRRRWVEFAVEMEDAGLTEIHTDRDGIVRLDEVADIKAVLSWHERKRLRRRVNDTLTSLAAEGRPTGGPVFGYKRTVDDKGRKALEVDPDLAPHIRDAADMVLGGWSLSAVAREMESRGVPTRLGGRWTHSNVKGMLVAPVVAGQRVHRGKVIRVGNWEPILDEVTWKRLRERLVDQREVTRPDGTVQVVGGARRNPGRRYLLTGGIACCGREGCGAALVARRRLSHSGERQPLYFCDVDHGGCGRLGALAGEPVPDGTPGVETTVVAALLTRLQSPAFLALLAVDDTAERRDQFEQRLGQVDRRDAALAQRWAQGNMTDAAWDAARAELDATRTVLANELGLLAPVDGFDAAAVVQGWPLMDLPARRLVIDQRVERVVVSPAKPGIKVFDPSRITIEWR